MKKISHLKLVIILFCLFSLNLTTVSCKLHNALTNHKANTDDELDPNLKRNRELWLKSNICSYKMTLQASNLSPTGFITPVNIEIQDGLVLNIELSSNPKNEKLIPEQIEFIQNQYKEYLTIERLLNFAKFTTNEKRKVTKAGRPDAVRLEISYDFQYGYPKRIIYARLDKTDTYKNFEVKKFEILKAENPCY